MAKYKEKATSDKLSLVRKAIENYDKNEFTFYFFVVDSRNTPNGEMCYIYQMAKTLHDMGYNVTMLYQMPNEYTKGEIFRLKKKGKKLDPNKIFVGVGDWLGEEYMQLPHLNIATQHWQVSPSDFLFIPEVFYSLMHETNKHRIPCRRIVLLHNYDLITENIPAGAEWRHFNIHDCLAQSEYQKKMLQGVFPYMKNTKVIPPYIPPVFHKPAEPKKLVVNIIARDFHDSERISKTFYWKNPLFKFVAFRYINGCSVENLAEILKESPITVWVDSPSSFGISPLAAMRCGNLVIGKVPENIPEWMVDADGNFRKNGIWTYDFNAIVDILPQVVESWIQEGEFGDAISEVEETNAKYTFEQWKENVSRYATDLIQEQTTAFKAAEAYYASPSEPKPAEAK